MTKVIKVTFQIEVDSIFRDAHLGDGRAQDLTIEDLVNQANEERRNRPTTDKRRGE